MMTTPQIAAFRMAPAAIEASPDATVYRSARVIDIDESGTTASVEISGSIKPAAVAVGCLVRPMPDDLVLVFCEAERIFVLNVLERLGPNWAVVALPGRGNISVEGETITLTARQRMSLRAETIDLQAKLLAALADKTAWIGKLFTLMADRIHSSSRAQEVNTDTLIVKAVERFAIIDRIDSLQADTQVVKIAGIATETAHSKVIAVTDDLRLDGKRVTVA
jgi:hypothetical protein